MTDSKNKKNKLGEPKHFRASQELLDRFDEARAKVGIRAWSEAIRVAILQFVEKYEGKND